MKPQSIAFSATDLLTSVHGSGSAIGARLAAVTNLLMPVHLRRRSIVSSYVESDVAVTAHNPFLAAFVVEAAVRHRKSCVVVPGGPGEDDWPYDLMMSKPIGELLVGIFGDEGIDNATPVALQLISRFLRSGDDSVVIANEFGFPSISRRQPNTALALFGETPTEVETNSSDPALRSLAAAFRVGTRLLPRFEQASWGHTAIFCRELVVTGMASGLGSVNLVGDGQFEWGESRITPLGSAASKPRSHALLAQAMAQTLRELPEFRFKTEDLIG
jgi:hypothetical protein